MFQKIGRALELQAQIEDLKRVIDGLEATVALGSEPEKTKPRVITKMAKNVQHGEVVELPDGRGSGAVMGWGQTGDDVLILLPGNRFGSFKATDYVRVLR